MNTACQALKNIGYRADLEGGNWCSASGEPSHRWRFPQYSTVARRSSSVCASAPMCPQSHRATQSAGGTFKGHLVPLPCDKRAPMAQSAAQSPECRPEATLLPRALLVQCAKPLCLNCSQFTYGWISQRP